MMDEGWAWSDAWIFVSTVIAGKVGRHRRSPLSRRPEGVRLVDVLTTAEHLNQAIPTREEIETGVRRLLGAGLVSVSDGWFQVTEAGEQLWRDRPRSGLTTTVDSVHGVLDQRYTTAEAEWQLDDQDHAAAMLEYTGRFLPPAPRRSVENSAAARQGRA
ncbi:hypothetical protein [Solwaraspora sp. WMMD792]|uniref:hypothetical protein n=1 Tax=unclassified Solwaraspora TaxID=2627926 RepID=UPI0024169211|nr:hypothetical protein [Solwaraspora sp. WMMD792]MDG4771888.1 hypothetical protein [Solwaraspora sp. WMMD792]